MANQVRNDPQEQAPLTKADLELLMEMVKSVHYGSVNLLIREGRVVQIEKNEKVRLV